MKKMKFFIVNNTCDILVKPKSVSLTETTGEKPGETDDGGRYYLVPDEFNICEDNCGIDSVFFNDNYVELEFSNNTILAVYDDGNEIVENFLKLA